RREELKRNKQARREARRKLRERQAAEGLEPQPKATIGKGKSERETVEEEKRARQETTEEQLRVYRCVLPRLLKRLAKIPDPGEPARADRTTHPQQEILSLPDFALLSHRYRWDREAEAGLAVDRAVSGAAGANQAGRGSDGDPAAIPRVCAGSEAGLCQWHDHPAVKRIPKL